MDVAESNILSEMAQMRIETVGKALLGLGTDVGRPSFNTEANGILTISKGTAQVGSMNWTANDRRHYG